MNAVTSTPRPGKTALLEQLAADGLRYMFGNPGTVEQGFLDELESVPGLRYVLTLQETVAVGIADGYARASGGAALVQLHSGVGLGNGVGMLYQAMRGHTPLVVLAGEAGIAYDALDGQMAADLVAMARPVTKFATRVVHPGSLLRVLRRAVRLALTPPRGPVFVALPMDVLDESTSEPVLPTHVPSTATVPSDAEIARAAALLSAAREPVIVIGDGVAEAGAQQALTRVAELLGAPVWEANSSTVNMDTAHPLHRGQLGHMFGTSSAPAVASADAVLVVGTYLFPEVFPLIDSPLRPDATIVHIDLDSYEIGKNHPVTLGLVAEPGATLRELAKALERLRPSDASEGGQYAYREPAAHQDGEPLATTFARELGVQAAQPLVLFDEALTASGAITAALPPRTVGSYHQTRGGSLGVGIPGAIGIKLARPEATVVGFTGDGGSMYTFQALWTAARYGIDAKFVVCDNRRYRLLDDNLARYRSERGILPRPAPEAFDLAQPPIGFVGLAAALGVPGMRVEEPGQVPEAVSRLLGHEGPYLIHLLTR